jgi:hypothetical protein
MDLYSEVEMDNRKTTIFNRDGMQMNKKGKEVRTRIWIFCYVVLDPRSQASILNLLPNGLTKLTPSMMTL